MCGRLLAVPSLPGSKGQGLQNCGWRLTSERRLSSFGGTGFVTLLLRYGSSWTRIKLVTPALQDRFLTLSTREAPADLLIWDFCPPRQKIRFCCFKPPSLWTHGRSSPRKLYGVPNVDEGSCGKQEGNAAGTESKKPGRE